MHIAMSFSSSSLKNPIFVPNRSDQRGHNHLPPGEIRVIFGPMFAGKTTALLRWVNSESQLGRRKFGLVLDIIPIADTVMKLTARCELCGTRAFFTLRKTVERRKELIGGANMYMPVCPQHYINGKSIMESAKEVLESH